MWRTAYVEVGFPFNKEGNSCGNFHHIMLLLSILFQETIIPLNFKIILNARRLVYVLKSNVETTFLRS